MYRGDQTNIEADVGRLRYQIEVLEELLEEAELQVDKLNEKRSKRRGT
jgi:hypothetical protein